MTKSKVIFIFLFSFGLFACIQKENNYCDNETKDYYYLFDNMPVNKDTTRLINKLNRITEKHSDCIASYLIRGDLYFQLGDFIKAKNDYKKVIFLDTSNIYAYYKLGILLQEKNEYDSSIFYIQLAINKKVVGGFIVDNSKLVNEKLSIGKYDVESTELLYVQGISYYYKYDFEEAIEYFNRCIENKHKVGECLLYRGASNYNLKNKNQACLDFKSAVELGNKDAEKYILENCK